MSLEKIQALKPNKAIAVISIYDSATFKDLPNFDGFLNVLRLNMLDVCEEDMLQAPGAWTEEPSPKQHSEYCGIDGNFAPSLSHARAIHAFVDDLQALSEELDLAVHCSFGISRSAAVAWWTSERFDIKLHDRAGTGLTHANPRITRLLRSLD